MAIRQEDRFPIIDILTRDAVDPRELAVGDLPAQPRRADARDGDGRGTRLHVQGLRRGPAGAHQPRHPPSARAAARQRPAADRDDERPAAVAAGHAGHLLRRRARHGRQHLPRRPRRRAHADAVEPGPERGLLVRQPAEALPAGRDRSRVPRLGGQRGGAAGEPPVAALVDAPADRAAQALRRVRPRHDRVPAAREPQGADVPADPRRRAHPRGREPVALRPVRRARPVPVPGDDAGRDARRRGVPADRRAAVPAHARPTRLLLVLARAAGRDGRGGLAAAADRAQGALAADRRERAREGGARDPPARVAARPALVRREGATHALGGDRGRDPRSRSVRDGRGPAGRLPRPRPCRVHGGGQRDLPGAAHGVGARGLHRAHASRLVARPAALRRRRARAARGAARAALRAGAARSDPRAQAPAGHRGCGRRVARPRDAEPARRDPRVDGAAGRAEQHVARVRRPPDPQAVSPGRGG